MPLPSSSSSTSSSSSYRSHPLFPRSFYHSSSPPVKNRRLFRSAFRRASPFSGRNRYPGSLSLSAILPADEIDGEGAIYRPDRIEPVFDVNQDEVELARHVTASIERLTADIERRESFSSISSCGQRDQFKIALGSLQTSLLADTTRTVILPVMEHASSSCDDEFDFERVEAPDAAEVAQYEALSGIPQLKKSSEMASTNENHESAIHERPTAPAPPIPAAPDGVADANILPPSPLPAEAAPGTGVTVPTNVDLTDLLGDLDGLTGTTQPDPAPAPAPAAPASDGVDSGIPESAIQDLVNEILPPPVTHAGLTHQNVREVDLLGDIDHAAADAQRHVQAGAAETEHSVDDILDRLQSSREASPVSHPTPPPPANDDFDSSSPQPPQGTTVELDPEPDLHSPSGDSGRDVVGDLAGDIAPGSQIPTSESLSGMRELSPEEPPFDRQGPLTIPTSVPAPVHLPEPVPEPEPEPEPLRRPDPVVTPPSVDEEPEEPAVQIPRPPTPPKDLSDEEIQPEAIDLGPPSHVHEPSPKGSLKPILKHYSDVGPWTDFKTVDPRVLDVIYWRDPKKSGAVLGAILLAILLVSKYSLISLIAYGSLAVLVGTLGFRLFKIAEAQVKKTDAGNPFKPYLEQEVDVPQDRIHAQVDVVVQQGRDLFTTLRRLFLVENVAESVKFGVLLWTLTYIGAWFSALSLVVLFVVGVFSVPKIYEIYQEPIDANIALVREQIDKVHEAVAEKLPFLAQAKKQE